MQSPKTVFFSIIIPVYNSENTLAENLKYIADQTFGNYELIFADGGSTDQTLRIIENFKTANAHMRTKLVPGPDKGIYDAMNKGLAIAEGEWLYFMGSDDRFCSPSVLGQIASEITVQDVDLIYGNVEGAASKTRYVYDTLSKVLAIGIHHQSAFYRASLFTEIGKYDMRFKIASDYDFTLKVFLNDRYRTRYIDLDIAYYGEEGYSSRHFDYKLFSGHYRRLAAAGRMSEVEDPQRCLNDCIYYCLHLALYKQNVGVAWSNMLYYLVTVRHLKLSYRLRTAFSMLMWTIRPSPKQI
ncbi:MAG TPA: glycosyltransferase family 2 protein [Mucilaginibacter sp.]|nr:glycosyltransferase family 2 protein [Mucilaginibacter sp.]